MPISDSEGVGSIMAVTINSPLIEGGVFAEGSMPTRAGGGGGKTPKRKSGAKAVKGKKVLPKRNKPKGVASVGAGRKATKKIAKKPAIKKTAKKVAPTKKKVLVNKAIAKKLAAKKAARNVARR